MGFRTLEWTSNTKLPCAGCTPANVLLCIDSDLIAQKSCGSSSQGPISITPATDFPYTTIYAQLTFVRYLPNNCGGALYRYTFQFDDTQLVPGSNVTPANVNGVICEDCVTKFIEEQAGNEVTLSLVSDIYGTRYRLTSQHGCMFDFPANPAVPSANIEEALQTLPAGSTCGELSGGVIYIDSNGELRTPPGPPFFAPQRVLGANPGVLNPPAAGVTAFAPTVASFTNNSCRPVWFAPSIEQPAVSYQLPLNSEAVVTMDITSSYAAPALNNFISRFLNASINPFAVIDFPSSYTEFPGPIKVNPGITVTVTAQAKLNVTTSPVGMVITIFGPHINYKIFPA